MRNKPHKFKVFAGCSTSGILYAFDMTWRKRNYSVS
uniref:Uncharacterized protein n=1 Tax=Lepeophtheirus salmonis TaxID=72036 RepID=A0A0K2UVQ5_LEPSM